MSITHILPDSFRILQPHISFTVAELSNLIAKIFPALLVALLLGLQPASAADKPAIMFWSWFAQEDFSQLEPKEALPSQLPHAGEAIGVAMLCGKIHLAARAEDASSKPKITVIPRLNGLALGDKYCEGVVRLEIEDLNPSCEPELINALVQRTCALVFKGKKMDGLQIDFDARASQRKFYACYLRALREALPVAMPLSITALASWVMGDDWLSSANLPVDEVVPMFFSMGIGAQPIKSELDKGRRPHSFKGKRCLGLRYGEMREMLPLLATAPNYSVDRVYLFASHGWQRKNSLEALKLVQQTLARGKTSVEK